MSDKLNRFIIQTVVLALILLAATIGLLMLFGYTIPAVLYFLPLYFVLLNVTVHQFLLKANEKSPTKFVNAFMGALGLKMMVSLLLLIAFGLLFRDDLAVIAIAFIVMYLSFTALEVVAIVKEVQKTS